MEDKLSATGKKDKDVTKEQQQLVYDQVEELKSLNAALLAENDMFEQFISRLHPQDLVSQSAGENGEAEGSQSEGGGRGWRRRSRSSIVDRIQQLTLEQKLYVARSEMTETRQAREKLRQKHERIQENYKASLKEAELQLEEIRKANIEFERRLVKPLRDNRLEINDPDKLLQYIKDKSKINQLEKFSLKNQALKAHEKKLQVQLQQRRELEKAEYEEIFQEYNEQQIDKNMDELQTVCVKGQRALSSHKEMLQRATCESSELSNDLTKRKQKLEKIEEAIKQNEEERLKAQLFNQHLRRQMTQYEAPAITDYMSLKDKHKKLKQSVHTWERKVGIAEMALKTHSKAWNKHRTNLTPANSVEAGARSGGHQIPVKLPDIAEHSM